MPGHGFPLQLPVDVTRPRRWDLQVHEGGFSLVIQLHDGQELGPVLDQMMRLYGPATDGDAA
jgi:hypothetical protein